MIATLQGVVTEKLLDGLVLDVAGIGYGLFVANSDDGIVSTGTEVKFYIYEHIRENTHDLFGFLSLEGKALFELLLSVNGVGPRMAMQVLNLGSAGEVRLAIAEGNTKFIQGASGVGKRVAERIIVDLKDKVGLDASENATDFLSAVSSQDEAAQALLALGYSPQDAARLLHGIDVQLATAERVTLALKRGD